MDLSLSEIVIDNSSSITGLDSISYQNGEIDGSFTANYAKINENNLIVLGRTVNGNSNGSEGYIANKEAIGGLTSIEVNFTGSYITIYGSHNNNEWYRLETLFSSNTCLRVAGYGYTKICSNSQDKSDVTINSITYTYDSNKTYSVDDADGVTKGAPMSNHEATYSVSDVYLSGSSSNALIGFEPNYFFGVPLIGITKDNYIHYGISFYIRSDSRNGVTLPIRWVFNSIDKHQEVNLKFSSTYTKHTMLFKDLATAVELTSSHELHTIGFKPNWNNTNASLDNVHIFP